MSTSTQLARLGAIHACSKAIDPKLCEFEPFFKSMDYPVTTMLKKIGNWEILGILTPRFTCVDQGASDRFSNFRPSIMGQNSPTRESIFINGDNPMGSYYPGLYQSKGASNSS